MWLSALAVVAVGSAHAQKLGFVNGSDVVADGSTVVCEPANDPFALTGKTCKTGALALQNYTDHDIDCTVTLTLQDNTLNKSNAAEICMGGDCVPVKTWPFSKSFTAGAGKSVLAQYDATATQYGEMNSTLTIEGAGEKHSVNVKFLYADPTAVHGVASLDASSLYDVYTLTGKRVATKATAFQLRSFAKGIYLLRNATTLKVQKIVLR